MRGADYFRAENVVYVYGPTTEKMVGLHSKYKRMICQINTNCRTRVEDVPYASDEENAEYLSRLSLKYLRKISLLSCESKATMFLSSFRW